MLAGDLATGKAVLSDYINATIGFEELGHTGTPPKSLMRDWTQRQSARAQPMTAGNGTYLEVRTE